MIKLLHLADVHLDTAFASRTKALRTHLRDALRIAFRRAIDCALDEGVAAVLIAGDLFDDERLSFSTERFLVEQMKRLHRAEVLCIYVSGNHDPGGRAHRAASIDWPPSLQYIDTPEPAVISLVDSAGDEEVRIVAAGHETAHEQRNLAAQFPPATSAVPHIGVLHTQVTSAAGVYPPDRYAPCSPGDLKAVQDAHWGLRHLHVQQPIGVLPPGGSSGGGLPRHDRYAPCSPNDLKAVQYAYWALGHVHVQQPIDGVENAWYAGNLQGRHARETGPKGGLLVTIRNNTVTVEPRTFAPTQWVDLRLDDLDDVTHVQALEERVRDAHAAHKQDAPATDWLLRVTLSGGCPLASALQTAEQQRDLAETLTEGLDVRDVEVNTSHLTLPVDPDAYRGEVHLLGEVLDLIDRMDTDPALCREVLPEPLAGRPVANRDAFDVHDPYLRRLLDGLDREAVSRLLAPEA